MNTASDIAPKKQKRSEQLIANFVNGFATDWHMAVPESYKQELDIRLTPRIKKTDNGKYKEEVYTQGHLYNFKEGQIFFDSAKAYDIWKDSLSSFRLACKIMNAEPVSFSTASDVEFKKTLSDGFVEYKLYKPNDKHDSVIEIGTFSSSQKEFVNFLKFGTTGTKNETDF